MFLGPQSDLLHCDLQGELPVQGIASHVPDLGPSAAGSSAGGSDAGGTLSRTLTSLAEEWSLGSASPDASDDALSSFADAENHAENHVVLQHALDAQLGQVRLENESVSRVGVCWVSALHACPVSAWALM